MRDATARVRATERPNCTLISIEGKVDEKFDDSEIVGRRGVVVFDLGGVSRFTSQGILHWINALKSLQASYYCFVNCRPSAMDQFNLVQAFPQRGELVTFYAPFVCAQCDKPVERLIDLRHNLEIDFFGAPEVACPKCGAQAEFDDVPDLYFRYVLSVLPPRPPPEVAEAIGDAPGKTPRHRRFELKKTIGDRLTVFGLCGYLDSRDYFKRADHGVDKLAMLELAELDGMAEQGAKELAKFIQRLDAGAVIARVGEHLVEPLQRFFADHRKVRADVVSFLIRFRCPSCMSTYSADVAADQIADMSTGNRRTDACPNCMHGLEAQCSAQAIAAATALPIAPIPPEVGQYLQNNPPVLPVGVSSSSPIDTGKLLLGKYEILRPLGQGGMGEVFLARQVGLDRLQRLVVLKRIRRDQLGDPSSQQLFLREAQIVARLTHPNIVQILNLEKINDEYLIAMEYVNGIDLARAIQLSRDLKLTWPVEICCRVITELCSALHAAHDYCDEQGRPTPIVHRDVSPSNILLSTDGVVKLADFGIAGIAGDQMAVMRGKMGYVAPEQMQDSNRLVDHRADIFAAGVVLYECLTLRPISMGVTTPVPGPTTDPTVAAARAGRKHTIPQICVARSAAPPLLQDVFERAIQVEPEHRYQSARDMGRDLERIGRMVSDTTTDDLALWVRRLVALKLEVDGRDGASPVVTLHTGQTGGSGPIRQRRLTDFPGRFGWK